MFRTLYHKFILDQFHKRYYNSPNTWRETLFLGVKTLKCPLDLWVYQEILFERQPDLIVECGTASGGSALFLATICESINHGRVLSIDIEENPVRPQHSRIKYCTGSSTNPETLQVVKEMIAENDKVMVILDSDHHHDHVLAELKMYSQLVSPNQYLIVEDTNLNGYPVRKDYGPGPMEAVNEFLQEDNNFTIDSTREKLLMTFNPQGFLLKNPLKRED